MPTTLPSQPQLAEAETRACNVHEPMPTPRNIANLFPASPAARRTVGVTRAALRSVLERDDDRFLVVVGPCSIHDTEAALEYAERLNRLRRSLDDRLLIVMRVYLEKPRTTIGWRGLVNDPHLDGSF